MRSIELLLKTAFKDLDITEIQLIIDKAAQCYYRTSGHDNIISDEHYDMLIAMLRELNPNDIRLSRIGIPYSIEELRTKVKHPIPMGSLDNTDSGIDGYDKWYDSVLSKLDVAFSRAPILASLKLDGSSIRLRYKDGNLVEAVTRGNGEVGENITANAINFYGVPTVLTEKIDLNVRGEAILHISDYQGIRAKEAGVSFDKIAEKDRSNPRNIGNGIIGRDNGADSEFIRFIAFNIETDRTFSTELEKLQYLNHLGFQSVPHRFCKSPEDVRQFYASSVRQRDKLPFEIDGIVVVVNSLDQQNAFITSDIRSKLRPKYARAIKFDTKTAQTVIVGVELTVGHTGAIIPTAVLKEVRIGGVNVTHVLLNNWDEIDRLDIAIGDTVTIGLAGDIIPKCLGVIQKGKTRQRINEPKRCPACGEPTTRNKRNKKGAVTYCSSDVCSEIMFQKIDHWIGTSKKGVGILGIGDAILRTLWDKCIVGDPADLYTITVDQIEDLEIISTSGRGGRIGNARAIEIIKNVAEKRTLPLYIFLGSLGIELLGRRRVQILQKEADGDLDTLDDWLDDTKLKSIKIAGFGDAIRNAVCDGVDKNRDLIKKLISVGVSIETSSTKKDNPDGSMHGVSFCFTGTRECIDQVQALGAIIKNSVAKTKPSPDFLVQLDPMSRSGKTKNAEANEHTRIISLDFLKEVLDNKKTLPNPKPIISDIEQK